MKITQVLGHEHRVIEQVLDCLEQIASSAAAGGELDRAAAAEVLLFLRTFADRGHHGKEEDCLFPAMVAKGIPGEVGPIGVMLAEHETGRAEVRAMGAALETRGPESVPSFVAHARAFVHLLRDHIAKEDGILFPLADSVLPEADQEALLAAFERTEPEDREPGQHAAMEALAERLARRFGVPLAAARSARAFGGCVHQHEATP